MGCLCWCWHCRKPTASKACEVCHSPYLYFPGIMPIHALIVQSHTKTHSAWIMLVHTAAIWDLSPWPPIGQPTGLLTSAMVEFMLHLIILFTYVTFTLCQIHRNLGLALVGPSFVLRRVYAFIQPVAKEFENQQKC